MNFARQWLVALLVVLSCAVATAQIASESELAAISARGRMLYEYDQVAWHATDAVIATNPPKELLGRYIARKTGAGWEVAFGRLNNAKDAYVVAVIATQGASFQQFTVKRIDPPQPDTGFYFSAARALELATSVFNSGVGDALTTHP
jgi:hypothetical protein